MSDKIYIIPRDVGNKGTGKSLYFMWQGTALGIKQEGDADYTFVELKGKEGQEKIGRCLDLLRADEITEVNGVKVVKSFDYKSSTEKDLIANTTSKINLPKSNVLKYILEDDSWFVVRPSGTEPKMKVYLAVKGNSLEDADKQTERFKSSVMAIVNEKLN